MMARRAKVWPWAAAVLLLVGASLLLGRYPRAGFMDPRRLFGDFRYA